MGKTRCPQCSAEFDRQGDFCPVCGYALTFVKEQEDEPVEQFSERLPGEVLPSPAPEPEPPAPVIETPVEEPPAPEPPPAEIIVVPPPALPPRRKGLPMAAKAGLGIAALVLIGAVVWAIVASQQGESTQHPDGQNGSTEQSSIATATTSGLSEEESYQLLVTNYATIGTLSAQIGQANPGDTYGGTGFAYEVFNDLIGDPDKATRESLVTQCETLLKKVTDARQELDAAEVATPYKDQKTALLDLYSLLEQRMQVLVDTATVAVDAPDESAWRPVLSPKSADLRRQFEAAYPLVAPSHE